MDNRGITAAPPAIRIDARNTLPKPLPVRSVVAKSATVDLRLSYDGDMRNSIRDWLIVGGGPQGAYAAASLRRAAPNAELAIIDPNPPLYTWRRCAEACGMAYLRSPSAHHLGARANDLRVFAAGHGYGSEHWLGVYRRPSRTLFEHHAATTLFPCPRIETVAEAIEPAGNAWRVIDNTGATHYGHRVVLATGPGQPYRPFDAPHIFDADFKLPNPPARLAVVGGGISGAQLALRAMAAGHAVSWITRHRPRQVAFDSDPCFAGPKCLRPFQAATRAERQRQLAAARYPGTLPPVVYGDITAAIAKGRLDWCCTSSSSLTAGGLVLGDGRRCRVDQVLLATGFANQPSPDSILGRLAARYTNGFDIDGHLNLDASLQLAPDLHVLGRAASLKLGPMAPNIKGARMAGARLASIARNELLAA